MHLFLYQAARHAAPSSPYSRSNRTHYVQSTIRGDFDLELLKRGIKGRYKILPHGQHPFQTFLAELELKDEFYGHIVQIEDKKNAVWFKLNYDQVGKNVTKYIGGWRDLNPEDLSSVATEFKVYKTHLKMIDTQVSQTRYQMTQLTRYLEGVARQPLPSLDPVKEPVQKAYDALSLAYTDLINDQAHMKIKMEACQQVVKDYLKERKL